MTGVQRSAYEIVSRLLRSDQERYRLLSPKVKGHRAPLLPVEHTGRIRRGHLWEQFELPRLVRAVGKDAVLYSPANSGPLAVTRQVLTIHDLFPIEHPEWFSRPFSAWYQWLLPRLVRKVTYILTNSQYTRQRVLDRFDLDEDNVVLCHFAQNERFVPASDENLAQLRVDQGLPERYLLAVGTVEPRKNVATLVAAWRLTSARKQGIKLVVAGGAAREAVFNASSSGTDALEDPTIRQLGYFPDELLPLLYQGAEAFVFPSLAEGFGLPVLEAMACGTPVICSNTTALPEISGGAAYLIPPLRIDAWAEAIDSVLFDNEVRQRMRSEGIRQAARFSWSHTTKIVRSTLEAVREVRSA